jgi:hypothetical protein
VSVIERVGCYTSGRLNIKYRSGKRMKRSRGVDRNLSIMPNKYEYLAFLGLLLISSFSLSASFNYCEKRNRKTI